MTTAPGPADPASLRKARGAFFTPAPLCSYLAEWAIRTGADRVLEPSCGEAAFLLAAADRLTTMADGGAAAPEGALSGVDVHAESARRAGERLAAAGHRADLTVADFFTIPARPHFDAVIGNPPFVRYQEFTAQARAAARRAALHAGVRLSNLASSWAAFTVHCAGFLRPGGRLALVLPAELLSVNYAAEVRRFLLARFGSVRLVLFTERVFPGVREEVVLLLAEGAGPTDHCELSQVRDMAELVTAEPHAVPWAPTSPTDKWTAAMLPAGAQRLFDGVTGPGGFGTLHGWGETTLGAVTGNNGYFTLSPHRARELGLRPGRDLIEISPPGSRHLRGLSLTADRWRRLGEQGGAGYLFSPASGRMSAPARRYVAAGEEDGVQHAYKCRVRRPWWQVPLVPPAELLLTCMNADTPRLTTNAAGVHHLNSVHGVYLRPGLRALGRRLLPIAALNSVTVLGAELVGRAYGGGMLKIEPREADLLPIPAPALVDGLAEPLAAQRRRVAALLREGRLSAAVEVVDEVLLTAGLGVDGGQLATLRQARATLAGRRAARARSRSSGA